jgi:hypothetical protein
VKDLNKQWIRGKIIHCWEGTAYNTIWVYFVWGSNSALLYFEIIVSITKSY